VIALVTRNDRGIRTPSDLKGKTIAVPKGTAAEFFLGRYLTLNGMDIRDVTPRYLAPADLVQSVVNGSTDAAIIWEPHVYTIERQMGDNRTTWPAQAGQHFYWVTYTRDDVIRDRPEMIRDYLRALGDAETYLSTHETESKVVLQQRVNQSEEYIDRIWKESYYGLSLEQGLIVAMEDEARWMAVQNMTGGKARPSYAGMVEQGPMREIMPSAVTIIG
jgi:NitT/TauT family transport system substrate-binding protein